MEESHGNIIPYKGRAVEPGQEVQVYLNTHNDLYSIRDKASGLVLGHATGVHLAKATYHVGNAGRQKVIETGQKNVHAWVEGGFIRALGWRSFFYDGFRVAVYNPLYHETFVDADTLAPVEGP